MNSVSDRAMSVVGALRQTFGKEVRTCVFFGTYNLGVYVYGNDSNLYGMGNFRGVLVCKPRKTRTNKK